MTVRMGPATATLTIQVYQQEQAVVSYKGSAFTVQQL